MERGALFGKDTFVMDKGNDDNKMFLKIDSRHKNYIIQLAAKCNLFFHNKWIPATELHNRRKGKMPLINKGLLQSIL